MEWFAALLIEKVILDKYDGIIAYIYKVKYKVKIYNLAKNIEQDFLKQYGNETYYHPLDRYFTNNKIVNKIIVAANDIGQSRKNYIELIQDIVNDFLLENNLYENYRNDIELCIKKLFDQVFIVANKIINIDEKKLINNISRKMDDNTQEIKKSIQDASDRIIADYYKKTSQVEPFQMTSITLSSLEGCLERPMAIRKFSMRNRLVSKTLIHLKTVNWIHIYGSFWSGKTMFLYLLSEKVMDYKWINLEYFDNDDIVESIKKVFQYESKETGFSTKEIISNFVSRMSKRSILFLDGIQYKHANSCGFLTFFYELYNICSLNEVKIITSGYCDMQSQVAQYIKLSDTLSMRIPFLEEDEIEELLDLYHAPKDENRPKVSRLLGLVNGSIPGLIVEMIRNIKDTGWYIDTDFWYKLFSSDMGDLERILEILLIDKLNETERKFLYIISFVGHDMPESIFVNLSKIIPNCEDYQGIKIRLIGRWIQCEGGIIKNDKKYKGIAEKNLTAVEKEQVHKTILEYYESKKNIDQFEFINVMAHLIALKLYDDAGYIYVQALANMIESKLDDPLKLSKFWCQLPTPQFMKPEIKVLVRFQQIRYLSINEQGYDFAINDLIDIYNETNIGGELLVFLSILLGSNHKIGDILLEVIAKDNLWESGSQLFSNAMDDSTSLLCNKKLLFETTWMVYSLSIENIEQMKGFIRNLKYCDRQQINDLVDNHFSLLDSVWERVWRSTGNYSQLNVMLDDILEWSLVKHLNIIASQIYVLKMRIISENFNSYEEAVKVYEEAIANIDEPLSRHILIDGLAKINVDNKNVSLDLSLIDAAFHSINDCNQDVFSDMYTYLNYIEFIPDIDKKISASKAMLNLVALKGEEYEYFALLEKIEAEYFINAYLCGKFEICFSDFYIYIMKLVDSKNSLRNHILVYLCHVIGYMVPDIISGKPPRKLQDGEDYAAPVRKLFINMNTSEQVLDYYSQEKVSQALLLVSELAYFYEKYDISKNIINKLVSEKMLISKIPSLLLLLNGYLSFSLLENGFYKQYMELFDYLIGTQGEDEAILLRPLLYISLYIASNAKKTLEINVSDELIEILSTYSKGTKAKYYINEFASILKAFKEEKCDRDILFWCGDKIKGTELHDICGTINILMLAVGNKEKNIRIINSVEEFLRKYSMDDDVFVRRKMDVLME